LKRILTHYSTVGLPPERVVFFQGIYRDADKSLARPGRKEARKHVRDTRNFNKIETRAVIKFLFLQGKAPKEVHAILTEALACFLPDVAKDLSAPLYVFGTFLKIDSDFFPLHHSIFFFRMEALSFQSYEMNRYIKCRIIVLFGQIMF